MTDLLNPERTDRTLTRILELILKVRRGWEEATDAGTWLPRHDGGRGSMDRASLAARDPVSSAERSLTQRQARRAAKHAARLIEQACDCLIEADDVLHAGLLRTDPDVLAEYIEKRSAWGS